MVDTLIVDKYFTNTKEIVSKYGDIDVTYAVFMRRPVIFALEYVIKTFEKHLKFETSYKNGDYVGSGEPLLYYSGKFSEIVEYETELLQLVGASCISAYNAYFMCISLPNAAFIGMDGRHCTGKDMMIAINLGVVVGSERAKKQGARGFIGTSNQLTSLYFGQSSKGTMPHALIGYAGSTLEAAKMYDEVFPDEDLAVLVDYYGKEITDSLEVCNYFKKYKPNKNISLRIDTHGGRFLEGLDTKKSYEILDKYVPETIRHYRTETELKHLIGTGVSASAIWYFREKLNENGFGNVKIIASSGFSPEKCEVMRIANAPIDVVGTGSYIPEKWTETYATADVIKYGDNFSVKKGREFLIERYKELK